MTAVPTIRPVIMSGGSGTRLWPLSRAASPKQFHRLIGEQSLFQQTALRVIDHRAFAAPVVLASASHEAILRRELQALNCAARLILEPTARNTAPAIAAAALACAEDDPASIIVALPADHAIADAGAFADALVDGAPYAADGKIVTFGVAPTRAETGYGYIQRGASLGPKASAVAAFKEKPDLETAEQYVASGAYCWNGGIFMFRADVMIDELRRLRPDILAPVADAVARAGRTEDRLLLDHDAFAAAPKDSIDYAVMEKTDRAAVVEINVGWSDVGSWASLWDISEKDADGNVGAGGEDGALLIDCQNVLALSAGPKIAAIGVDNVVVIATPDGIVIANRDKTQDVKKIVEKLKASGRTDLL